MPQNSCVAFAFNQAMKGELELRYACQRGDLDYIRDLSEDDPRLCCFYKAQTHPLIIATSGNHAACVQELIKKGILKGERHHGYVTQAFCIAARVGCFDALKVLVQSGVVWKKQYDGDELSPIHIATMNNHHRCVRFLLSSLSETERTPHLLSTLLCIACKCDKSQMAEYLIKKGADVDAPAQENMCPLQWAILLHRSSCVKKLIAYGADINRLTYPDNSPMLVYAYENNADKCIEELVYAGADINVSCSFQCYSGNLANPLVYWALRHKKHACSRLFFQAGAVWPKDIAATNKMYPHYKKLRRERLLLAFYLTDMTVAAHIFSRDISCADACVSF